MPLIVAKLVLAAVAISCADGFRIKKGKKIATEDGVASSVDTAGEEEWLGRRRKAAKGGIAGGGACAGKFRQCGGKGWSGPTCCTAGLFCKKTNVWYSQCRNDRGGAEPAPAPAKVPANARARPRPRPGNQATPRPAPVSGGGTLKKIGGNLGSGKTTRYWDCCKPSCSWGGKAKVSKPVNTCSKNGVTTLSDVNAKSVCDGGASYMCNSNQPWYDAASKMSYGFAAAHISGGAESSWCCACYQLTVSGGKKMVVQVTNTGGDLGTNHFDIQIPGGGFGIFDGCSKQWGATESKWGARYGGVMSAKIGCSSMPSALKASCQWSYDHWSDNPAITSFYRVKCPAALTSKTGCKRSDE